jgi:hypothetical protein
MRDTDVFSMPLGPIRGLFKESICASDVERPGRVGSSELHSEALNAAVLPTGPGLGREESMLLIFSGIFKVARMPEAVGEMVESMVLCIASQDCSVPGMESFEGSPGLRGEGCVCSLLATE